MTKNKSNLTKPQIHQLKQEDLWDLFLNGDMNAFHHIYNFHYKMLFNFGKKYLPVIEVEDCIHETYLSILRYKGSAGKVKNVKAYLFKCFRNELLRSKKNNRLEFNLTEGITPVEDNNDYSQNDVILKELKNLIDKLSAREREIIYLKYFQNFNNQEIAELLDIKYQTVRNILAGAIKKLRTLSKNYIQLLFMLVKN